MNTTLVINQELQDLLPPLDSEEYAGLEEAILRDGCTDPLTAWGEILVDGHHRYKICRKHNLSFKITQKQFDSLADAKIWMCERQDNRRNLTLYQRAVIALKMKPVLAEKAKENQKQSKGQGKKGLSNLTNLNTRFQLSEKFKISSGTLHMVEFLEKNASDETKQRLQTSQTSINKEFTRLKAEIDAQKPKTEKKSRSKSTSKKSQEESSSKSTASETKTSETKTKTTKPDPEPTSTSEHETTTSGTSPETVTVALKSSPKVKEQYCCGIKFEPDPDDDFFDWITDEEREELKALNDTSPNRLVPQIHNFTIQNIPEHSAEPLIDCLYSLFKAEYRRKLARGLLRRMFAEDDRELTLALFSELYEEFQNQ